MKFGVYCLNFIYVILLLMMENGYVGMDFIFEEDIVFLQLFNCIFFIVGLGFFFLGFDFF